MTATTLTIRLEPLTRGAFSEFGDVIETENAEHYGINAGTIERFNDLADIQVGAEDGGKALVSIARCNTASTLPHEIAFVERHVLGSQAFIPMDDTPLVVAVAPRGNEVDPRAVRGFITNGRQGFNYRPGVWHMPLVSFKQGQEFLIVDRGGPGEDCEEFHFHDCTLVLDY